MILSGVIIAEVDGSMILQTGMRTDIPAFYTEWFLNRLNEGFVWVRNPYNPSSITEYEINPNVVDLIAFCTKNPAPMLKHMEALKPYGQYWFVTITPYGKEIEPNVPPKEKVMEDFKILSDIVGINSVGWRYDPIFISDTYTLERHIAEFEKMAENLCGYTQRCIISFVDIYKKVMQNFPQLKAVKSEDKSVIGREFVQIGKKYDMEIVSCAEGNGLAQYGVTCGGCYTKTVYEKAMGSIINMPKKGTQRNACACFFGNDIGAYNTCGHFCRYCYANTNEETVRINMKNHNPFSPLLFGEIQSGDKIHKAEQKSWINPQISFE